MKSNNESTIVKRHQRARGHYSEIATAWEPYLTQEIFFDFVQALTLLFPSTFITLILAMSEQTVIPTFKLVLGAISCPSC
jgi:hypothetical protein